MSPFLRGSNSITKAGDGLWELKAFISEQDSVSTQDRKIFAEALRAQRRGEEKEAHKYYTELSNRYDSQVIWDNISDLV